MELNWSQYDKLMTLTGCDAIGRGLSHSESDERQQEVDLWSIVLLYKTTERVMLLFNYKYHDYRQFT